MLLSFIIIFFNGRLGDCSYLRIYWTDLHQIFRICTHVGGRDQTDILLFTITQGNRFLARMSEIGILTFFPCSGIPQQWKDGNMDVHLNTANDSSTSDKNLVNFGPVTPEICMRVCAGRAHVGLCHASSFTRYSERM